MNKVLIIQTAFLGDVVLATALVEKLRRLFPEASIDFLLRKGNEGLLKGHPHLKQVLVFNKKEKWKSLFSLIFQIRRERYDLVVNVQRFFTSGLLAASSGARQVVGFDKNPLAFAFHRRLPHRIGEGHEVERNLSLIAHLGDHSFEMPRLYPPKEAFDKAPADEKYLCVAPTSVWFTKQWPAEKWIDLINRLPADHRIFLLGAPSDREACEAIRTKTQHPWVENLAGKLSLLESAALIQGARMTYANDSAPIHLASAMNAPITAIFCSTVPSFGFGPLSRQSVIAETHLNLSCRPCGLHGYRACPEGHFRCTEIEVNVLAPSP